ncbi:MAG: ATP-binding protein [Bacteroidota bacterium]
MDSIYNRIPNNSKDTLILWLVIEKSNLFYDEKISDSVFYYDKLLYRKAKKLNNPKYLSIATNNIGSDFEKFGQLDSAYYYYKLSEKYSLELYDSLKVARRLLNIAEIQQENNDLFGAKETVVDALVYLPYETNSRYLAKSYDLLGSLNRHLLNYDDAIEYHEKAVNTSENKISRAAFRNNLALAYRDKANYNRAIEILNSIIEDSVLNKNSNRYARVLHNLAVNKWKNGSKNVEEDFINAIQLRKANKDLRGLVSSYTTLGEYYARRKPLLAKKYLDTLVQIARKVNMPQGEIDALEIYMELQPQNVAHKDRYIFLKDSLYQQELKVKTQFAKMKYDDEQEKARLLALEAETAQKEAQLAKEGAQRILLLSLLALVLMGGTSYYFLLRQRHKKKTLQEIYNTEKEISKKIHDGLANDVYGVMTAVQHQKGTPNDDILDQLEDIYQRTRDISHDTRELATGAAFAIELKDMVQGFSGSGTKVLIKGLERIPWEKLSEHKCVALHRTLKELLVNMKKHSGAGLVALNFGIKRKRLQVEYSDNGIGVQPGQQHGVGLQNTENRIQSVGGQFTFGGVAGKGAKATLTIPL